MKRLCTYSMVRTFYDRGQDYIDSFWPFVVSAFPESIGKSLSFEELQRLVEEKSTLHIPLHSLKTIIKRARRKGFVNESKHACTLTESGSGYRGKMEVMPDVQRRINACVDGLKQFLAESKGIVMSSKDTADCLETFIRSNIEYFMQFIIPNSAAADERSFIDTSRPVEFSITRYLFDAEKSKPEIFETLKDMIFGSIISYLLQSETLLDSNRNIEKTRIYLDTNLVFSILGLHFSEFNSPAKELFQLLEREKVFEIAVFDFTIQEMIRVLSRYSSYEHCYLPNIKVATIYSSLKAQGWTASRVREFIVRIEDELKKLHISIKTTGINLDRYTLDPDVAKTLLKYKNSQNPWNMGHDIEAIHQIKQLRRHEVRRIEEARYLFLTSDSRLAKYNYHEDDHHASATVCEIVPDRLMANLLWLKNPKLMADVPLRTIISMHSRDMFIDRNLWETFLDTITSLKKDGKIKDDDIAILLFDQQLVEQLQGGTTQTDASKPQWVLTQIDEAKKRHDAQNKKEVEKAVKSVESQFATTLLSMEQRVNREKEDKTLKAINETKEEISRNALRSASKYSNWAGILFCTAFLISAILLGNTIVTHWATLEPCAWIIQCVISVVLTVFIAMGWWKDVRTIRTTIESKVASWIYLRRLRHSKLEELVSKLK
jgi:hypothetical protein